MRAEVLILAALNMHQISKVWKSGPRRSGNNYAPVFALWMPRAATCFSQTLALPIALATAGAVEGSVGNWLSVGFLAVWLLGVQRRLANHAWLATVATVAFAFAPTSMDLGIARDLLAGVYLSAAVFKVNKEYLFSERSAGRVVTMIYLKLLGVQPGPILLRVVPFGVILIEASTGILLCGVPHGLAIALLLAIAMHAAFGVSGNFPFSIVALALWCVALAPADGHVAFSIADSTLWWWLPALSAALSLLVSRSPTVTGSRSRLLLAKDAAQGAIFGALCTVALSSLGGHTDRAPLAVHALIGAAFAANLGLVIAGLKLDWSFAMFSSLRPFGRNWLQRAGRGGWPRYYLLTAPARLPKPMLRQVPPSFLYKCANGRYAVHEGVVYRLERLAGQFSLTFSPALAALDEESGRLVPSGSRVAPRRTVLLFPALIPRNLNQYYLG